MTPLGVAFIGITVAALALSPQKALPWILGAALAFPASSALAFGNNGVVPFYTAALIVAAAMFISMLRRGKTKPPSVRPGRNALLAFTVWAAIITLVGPALFAGIEVLESRGGTDQEILDPSHLRHTVSNFAQIVYLLLGVTVVHYFARRRQLSPNLPALGLAIGTGLSFSQYVMTAIGVAWPTEFFSNARNMRYIDYTAEGDLRFRGIFAEPAQLATFSLVSLALFVSLASRSHGKTRALAILFGALATFNIVQSYTGTGLLGGLMLAAAAIIYWCWRFFIVQVKVPTFTPVVILMGVLGLILAFPMLFSSASGLADAKLDSSSFRNRFATAIFSIELALKVWLIGVGLGSNRPSSFIPMLLSCVGILGTVLFFCALIPIMRGAWKHDAFKPVVWALIAFFLTKVFGGSSIHEPLMWVCIGVCAYAAWKPNDAPTPEEGGGIGNESGAVTAVR